jgi:GGDEF domain-containing protein
MSSYTIFPKKELASPTRAISDNNTSGKGLSLPAVRTASNPAAVQLMNADLEEPLQTKPFQLAAIQPVANDPASSPNRTGLPDNLKAGVEAISGFAMDDVKVHYNSAKPAQLNAFAYAQGADIHVAPGQEQHLPHEAWHVVQQKQGRVQPTVQLKKGNPFQLAADGPVVQLNGKEKALFALGGALVMGLGMWLKSKYDENQAAQRQAAIVSDFEGRMNAAGFVANAQVREDNFVLAALKQGVQENVARDLFAKSGAAAKDTVTGYDVGADRIPSVQSAIDFIQRKPIATGYYVEVDIRNLGGLNGALGHTGADQVFRILTDISARAVESLNAGKVKVAKFRHGGDEFSFLVVAEDGSVSHNMVNGLLIQASEMIQKTMASTEIGQYNHETLHPHTLISEIEHPKHKGESKFNGTGIVFGISAILGTDTPGRVFSAADIQVEDKKK